LKPVQCSNPEFIKAFNSANNAPAEKIICHITNDSTLSEDQL